MKECLHIACIQGHVKIVEYLISKNMNPSEKALVNSNKIITAETYRDQNGNNLLHEACIHGKAEVVKYLVLTGMDVNEKNNV